MKIPRDETIPRRWASVLRVSKRPGQEPWEQPWNGLTWQQMPTRGGYEHQLFDFALFRWGMYDPEIDLVVETTDESEAEAGAVGKPRRTRRQRSFGTIGGRGWKTRSRAVAVLPTANLAPRLARQIELITSYVEARKAFGFVKAFYVLDCSAHSALARAMGKGRGIQGPLRSATLDRIERAFETLNEGGWKV